MFSGRGGFYLDFTLSHSPGNVPSVLPTSVRPQLKERGISKATRQCHLSGYEFFPGGGKFITLVLLKNSKILPKSCYLSQQICVCYVFSMYRLAVYISS